MSKVVASSPKITVLLLLVFAILEFLLQPPSLLCSVSLYRFASYPQSLAKLVLFNDDFEGYCSREKNVCYTVQPVFVQRCILVSRKYRLLALNVE